MSVPKRTLVSRQGTHGVHHVDTVVDFIEICGSRARRHRKRHGEAPLGASPATAPSCPRFGLLSWKPTTIPRGTSCGRRIMTLTGQSRRFSSVNRRRTLCARQGQARARRNRHPRTRSDKCTSPRSNASSPMLERRSSVSGGAGRHRFGRTGRACGTCVWAIARVRACARARTVRQ